MKQYIVRRREIWVSCVKIDADSTDEAKQLVYAGEGEELDDLLEYSHTLDTNSWDVENADTGELVD
jgi:hypothetical protein